MRVSACSRAPPARCPPGRVSVAVLGEHSQGSDAGSEALPARCLCDLVTVAVLGEHSRRSDSAGSLMLPRILPSHYDDQVS